jgi:predicted ATPase
VIQFPIIRRLDVRGYELFQNEKSEGITHRFDRGVHAIVGVNGLGKTTLLTMLYRALAGPYDQSKRDDAGLLSSKHELSNWRPKGFFSERVSDRAANATVEVDVAFGKRLVTIRRKLSNLEVVQLAVDGDPVEASQAYYQHTVLSLSGAATYFDFYAILRYLVFYLEDRVELVWDRRSQFDMMRLLLFDTQAAKRAAEAYDEAQSADSDFRTMRTIVNNDTKELARLEAARGQTQASEYRALQVAFSEAESRDLEQATAIEEARRKIDATRLSREKTLLVLQEARSAAELEEQAHYQHLFPDLGETAKHVFLNLLGGGACFVCGNQSKDAAEYLRDKLDQHRCPICDSTAEVQEKVVSQAQFSKARLGRLRSEVDKLRVSISSLSAEIEEAEKEYAELVERRDADGEELRRLRHDLGRLGPTYIPDEAEIEALKSSIATGRKQMDAALAERSKAEGTYGRIVARQKDRIEQATDEIRRRFRHFAGAVLAETCELIPSSDTRAIGQEGKRFDFPYFEVAMTSGVFSRTPAARDEASAVSESQREFLDIAFRLALISAVTGGKSDSMLVLETPESSLDSLFVFKAGEAFRQYAEDPKRNNVFIASTNLNNEEMLSALLGTLKPPKVDKTSSSIPQLGRKRGQAPAAVPAIPKAERLHRIINLLELAAPNAALKQYRAYYKRLFNLAVGR